MNEPLLADLYYKCSDCCKILSAYETSPCCRSSKAYFVSWPHPAVKELLKTISKLDISISGDQRAALLNLYLVIQILMEDLLTTLFKKHSKNTRNLNPDLFDGLSIKKMMLFFDSLNENTFAEMLKTRNNSQFLEKCELLYEAHKKLLHGNTMKHEKDNRELITSLFLDCQKVFAAANNDLAQATLSDDSNKLVLIIDDEEGIRESISGILKKEGWQSISAASGEEGVRQFEKTKPDIVFLDVSLPEMNGIDVLKAIKEIDSKAVVYFISGVGGEDFVKQALELGAKGYIAKPFYAKDIKNVLKIEFFPS